MVFEKKEYSGFEAYYSTVSSFCSWFLSGKYFTLAYSNGGIAKMAASKK
jgi:hypothetical protein